MHPIAAAQLGTYHFVAPAGTKDVPAKHEGRLQKKPWDFRVTAVIPHLDTIEPLQVVIELLRLQSERPYIMVIDTGSPPNVLGQLELMRSDDLEIHYVAGHGYRHVCEPVCVALDLAHSKCPTEYLFHTHADCFLRRRDFLESIISICNINTPVVGYRMSPRNWIPGAEDWEWMVGHVALMLHMQSIDISKARWSFQAMHRAYGDPWNIEGGWPDTEVGFNRGLREAGIKPFFLGNEENYTRQVDHNIDHPRSFTGSKYHGQDYHEGKAKGWMASALHDARERINKWRCEV